MRPQFWLDRMSSFIDIICKLCDIICKMTYIIRKLFYRTYFYLGQEAQVCFMAFPTRVCYTYIPAIPIDTCKIHFIFACWSYIVLLFIPYSRLIQCFIRKFTEAGKLSHAKKFPACTPSVYKYSRCHRCTSFLSWCCLVFPSGGSQ